MKPLSVSRLLTCFMTALFLTPLSTSTPPPLPQLWEDADTVILGLIENISLVNQTDQVKVYNVEVTVAEYLQDPADDYNLEVRHYSASENEEGVSFEKGERTILFLNLTDYGYYVLVRHQGKFTFNNGRYENLYGETIEPARGDTSAIIIGMGILLLVTITSTGLIWWKRQSTPEASQLK